MAPSVVVGDEDVTKNTIGARSPSETLSKKLRSFASAGAFTPPSRWSSKASIDMCARGDIEAKGSIRVQSRARTIEERSSNPPPGRVSCGLVTPPPRLPLRTTSPGRSMTPAPHSAPSAGLGKTGPAPSQSCHALPARGYSNLRRASSIPVVLKVDNATLIDTEAFSAEEWSLAVSPHRLEILRRRIALERSEASSLREALSSDRGVIASCESNLEEQRIRLGKLRQEEKHLDSIASCRVPSRSVPTRKCEASSLSKRLLFVREDTASLARHVSCAAALLSARCKALQQLRVTSRCARLEREMRVAKEAMEHVAAAHRTLASNVTENIRMVAKLREKAHDLRRRVGLAEGDLLSISATGRASLAGPAEEVSRLRARLAGDPLEPVLAIDRCAADPELGALRWQLAELGDKCKSSRSRAQCIAGKLQNLQEQEEARVAALVAARRTTQEAASWAAARAANCAVLEAELRQQCNTTAAWQKSINDLVGSHEETFEEATQVAQACRNALARHNSIPGGMHGESHVKSTFSAPVAFARRNPVCVVGGDGVSSGTVNGVVCGAEVELGGEILGDHSLREVHDDLEPWRY
eukprot:TRINITY_DN71263_c0_g1_i1.p1 TRINITY_DN71263_c0_g1~~TRINITY_DN71263_c0_g1_i1.p1  ORF type:complete len:584 (-),score=69.68 TRINITY_DN71263_c0_g1_i1:90-1841(-)